MSDLPKKIWINEEGPREGFQIEANPIPLHRKTELIEALAETGLKQIDCVSFVNPKRVPGMADADELAAAINKKPGVRYTGLWLNQQGLERAYKSQLDIIGAIRVTASEAFSVNNTNKNIEQTLDEQRAWLKSYAEHDVPVEWGYVMTAFGCNYEGYMPIPQVVRMVGEVLDLATEADVQLKGVYLADTVGWANPLMMERTIGAVREKWPDLALGLHLHDTRGQVWRMCTPRSSWALRNTTVPVRGWVAAHSQAIAVLQGTSAPKTSYSCVRRWGLKLASILTP